MPSPRLVVVVGQEGVGKSTVVRALLPHVTNGAVLDAEDVGQVKPWTVDEAFRDLHRRSVAAVVGNFWAAGYRTVVAGSFLSSPAEYAAFRALLQAEVEVTLVHLCAGSGGPDGARGRSVSPPGRRDGGRRVRARPVPPAPTAGPARSGGAPPRRGRPRRR